MEKSELQAINSKFNEIYYATEKQVRVYIISKCGNIDDCKDIFQETYVRLLLTLHKKGINYITNPEAYIMKVAKNEVSRHFTLTEKLKNLVPLNFNIDGEEFDIFETEPSLIDFSDDMCDKLSRKQLVRDILADINTRAEVIRKIFHLRFNLDLSFKEIAKNLSMSESTVKDKYYTTIEDLRRIYGDRRDEL